MIEHLSALYELSSNTGVTFVYCNYLESRTPITYIKLAIKQLCRRMQCLPPSLQQLYEKHYRGDSQPRYEELKSSFLAIAQEFNSIFLVLDALDECTLSQRANLCEFFSDIVELSVTPAPVSTAGRGNVKLFVTSRKEPDIERVFLRKSFPKIEIQTEKVDHDIKVYVQAQIEQRLHDGRLYLGNIALKDRILDALTSKAGGMYDFPSSLCYKYLLMWIIGFYG